MGSDKKEYLFVYGTLRKPLDHAKIIPGGDYLRFLQQNHPLLLPGGAKDFLLEDDFDYLEE